MLRRIFILFIASLNFYGCLAYNSIGIEDKNYSLPKLKFLMDESYIRKNKIIVELKDMVCPQRISAGTYKDNSLTFFFAATMGTPYWGKYHEGFSNLYVNKALIRKDIKCNCKTYKLISVPLIIGTYFWEKHTPGKHKFNDDDAIEYFLKEYETLPLEKREYAYKDQDDFLEMEVLYNLFNNQELVINYLVNNRKISLLQKLEKKLLSIRNNHNDPILNKIGRKYDSNLGFILSEILLKLKVYIVANGINDHQIKNKNGDPIFDNGLTTKIDIDK